MNEHAHHQEHRHNEQNALDAAAHKKQVDALQQQLTHLQNKKAMEEQHLLHQAEQDRNRMQTRINQLDTTVKELSAMAAQKDANIHELELAL